MTTRELFDRQFNGRKNFITPIVLDYRRGNSHAAEISTSEERMTELGWVRDYGVTVLRFNDGVWEHATDLGHHFHCREDAVAYANQITGKREDTDA